MVTKVNNMLVPHQDCMRLAAGKILDRLLMEQRPLVVLELGAHCGYSSVRIARALPLGGRLYSVEMDQGNAAITEKVLRLAGFDDDTVRGGANFPL